MTIIEQIINLAKNLLPTGRAFRLISGSNIYKLISGLSQSESRAYSDAISILDSALPDNPNFTTDDATAWEQRLGLITNTSVSLPNRILLILAKMNFPGVIPARAHYLYIQGQLQAQGFPVYVYENIFSPGNTTKSPNQVSGISTSQFQYGDRQYGQFQFGGGYYPKVANFIDENSDSNFDEGINLRSTFFIGGNPIGTYVNLPLAQKDQFRQAVLKLKQTQDIGYLFINFV